jgi:hypothetical protein
MIIVILDASISAQVPMISCQVPHVPWWHLSVGIFAVLTGLAAVFMALRGELSRREKIIWIVCVTTLTFLELRMITWSDSDAKKETSYAECELQKNFQVIETGNQQQFQATMTSVGQVFDKTKQAASTATEAVDDMTGGKAFCYLSLLVEDGNRIDMVPKIVVLGNHPLHQVTMRVVDYQHAKDVSMNQAHTAYDLLQNQAAHLYMIGDISVEGTVIFVPNVAGINLDNSTDKNYNIEFHASNGAWTEFFRFHKVKSGSYHSVEDWAYAIKVQKMEADPSGGNPHLGKVLFQKVGGDYPRTDGKVDWGH